MPDDLCQMPLFCVSQSRSVHCIHGPEPDLITIEFRSSDPQGDEADLHKDLRESLQVKTFYDLAESADWVPDVSRLYVPAAGYMVGKFVEYSGKKLIDVLTIQLQKWLDRRTSVSEVTLYGPDGKKITLRKN